MTGVDNERIRRVYAAREYEHQAEDAGVHAARELFFRAVHRVEPRVVTDLMGDPLTLYRPMFEESVAVLPEELRGSWWSFRRYPSWSRFAHARERDSPAVHQLRDHLFRWADKWRLTDEWCLEAAVDTLARLSAAGDRAEPEPLYYLGTRMMNVPFSEQELRFDFSHRGWTPTMEDWASAESRLDEGYRRAKGAYRKRIETMCQERGLKSVRRTRSRGGDHFEWLAHYQVGRETWTEIAARTNVTDDAVAKAVKTKAKEIRLTLADAARPGRPPGKVA